MPKLAGKHVLLSVVVIAGLIIFGAVRGCKSDVNYQYGYEEVSVGLVEKTVAAVGILDINGKQPVLAKTDGMIVSVKAGIDGQIKKGQVLALIDTTDIDQNLLRLNTRLESARLSIVSAERKYNGKKAMYNEKLISSKDLEQSELEYKISANDYKLLQIEYNETALRKKNAAIVSPIDGVVIESLVGEPSDSTQGIRIGQNSTAFFVAPTVKKMVLVLDIDESDIGSIKKGQKVSFTVSAFPDKKFSGEITSVSNNPVYKGSLVVYQATVVCGNDELLLKRGMTATATVTAERKENVLRISNQAFIVSPEFADEGDDVDGTGVWKKSLNPLSEKSAERVAVKTGLAGDMFTEITEGLSKGDEILVRVRQSDE